MKQQKVADNALRSPWVFYAIVFMLPVVLFVLLEAGLRQADYGENLNLFIPAGAEHSEHLRANPEVRLRYFSKEDKPVYPRADLFLKEKPENGYRVFMLGGSSAVGWPFGANMMPSRPLAARLGETFPDKQIEVINLAFTAINTYSQLDFVDEILEHSPDAVLIYSGHNEFYGALGIGSAKSVGSHRTLVNAYLKLQRLKSFQLMRDAVAWVKKATVSGDARQAKVSLMHTMAQKTSIPYEGEVYQQGVQQFEGNLHDMIGSFKEAGVDVIMSELVSNLKDQPPFISLESEGEQSAEVLYRSAVALEASGRFDEAREAYTQSKDHDALRFRAPESFNEIIRRLGTEYDVPVVAMKSYFEAASPGGIVGSNLMMEHLHPNAEGYFLMAEAFYDTMQNSGMIATTWPAPPEATEFRQRWGISEFDYMLAELRVMELKDKWPYKSVEESGESFKNFRPGSKMETLILRVFMGMTDLIAAHRQMAAEYEAKQDADAAMREYRAMIAIFPYAVELYIEAAKAAYRLRMVDDVLPLLLRAVEIKPRVEDMIWIGQIYLHYDKPEQALGILEKAYVMDLRNDIQLITLLVQAYELTGRQDKAMALKMKLPAAQ